MVIEEVGKWYSTTVEGLAGLWRGFLNFIPRLIGAIIVFVVGWIIAVWVGKLVAEVLKRIKFDRIFEKTKWEQAMTKAEVKTKMSGFVGAIVKWVVVIVFLGAAVKILAPVHFGDFINPILGYLPNLVVAAGIFVAAVIIADFAEKLVKVTIGKMSVAYVNLVGSVVRWAVWVLAAVVILSQLGVKGVEGLFQILVGGIVLGLALAFGLGGRDAAKEALDGIRHKIRG